MQRTYAVRLERLSERQRCFGCKATLPLARGRPEGFGWEEWILCRVCAQRLGVPLAEPGRHRGELQLEIPGV